jgi:hypothetical protein
LIWPPQFGLAVGWTRDAGNVWNEVNRTLNIVVRRRSNNRRVNHGASFWAPQSHKTDHQ